MSRYTGQVPFLDYYDQDILFSGVIKITDRNGMFRGVIAAQFGC